MSAPTSWAWTIYNTDGVSVLATFTTQNPSYTFPAAGSYFVRLVATNAQGSGDTGQRAIQVIAPGAFTHIRTTQDAIGSDRVTVPSIAVGDLLIVSCIGINNAGPTAFSDGLGNTYTPVSAALTGPTTATTMRMFWCASATTGSASPVAIVGTFPSAPTDGIILCSQYVHTGTVSLLAHQELAQLDAVAGPIALPAIQAAQGPLLLYGINHPTSLVADPAGWNVRQTPYHLAHDRVNESAGTYAYQPMYSGVGSYVAQLAAFTTATIPVGDAIPTIAITSPTTAPTYATSSATVVLSGTAADDVGVVQVQWNNTSVPGVTGDATGTTTWSTAPIPLQVGLNTLLVAARDTANQFGDAQVAVTYTPTLASGTIYLIRVFQFTPGKVASAVIRAQVPVANKSYYANATYVPIHPFTTNVELASLRSGDIVEKLVAFPGKSITTDALYKIAAQEAQAMYQAEISAVAISEFSGLRGIEGTFDGTTWSS